MNDQQEDQREYVVCDKCGEIETHVVYALHWKCPECGSESAWLFANARAADEHARAIKEKAGLAS